MSPQKIKHTSRVFEVEGIVPLFASARAAKIQEDSANELLAAAMLEWIREQLPSGTLIDLRHKPGSSRPEYLHNVRVASGNSKGTRLFRIERIRFVEANAKFPELSNWYADATPISMATGKDMRGTAGNAKHSREFLGVKGSFGFISYDED